LTHRKHGKAFFFEKKKQKAFVCAVADLAGKVRVSTRKSFLVLFLEKGLLATSHGQGRLVLCPQLTDLYFALRNEIDGPRCRP
jgi:hypothetical protein